MIDEKDAIKVESNVQGDKIVMGIDQESFGHVMDLLANAYGDPMMAVLREYATNGRDATIEAGRNDPVEVTLPNHLAPTLSIRDYGVGLSKGDIAAIYSQYGASTKRGTNSQTGMLGIGCKSALAYAPQFTVQSVKGGQSITVLVSRDEDGGGSMTVLDERSTSERDGTTIMVAVQPSHVRQFTEKAEYLFSFWPKGSVLVNGAAPQRFDTETLKLRDNLYITEDADNDVVVMGGVPYPANLGLSVHVVAFVPLGDVAFPPSRESLKDTPKTRATLQRIKDEFKQSITGAVQREVDAAKTPAEAIQVVTRWRSKVPGSQQHGYTWRGIDVPRWLNHSEGMLVNRPFGYGKKSTVHKVTSLDDSKLHCSLLVYGFDPDQFTATHHNKCQQWCKDNNVNVSRYGGGVEQFVMLRGDKPDGDVATFIPPKHLVSYDTINAVKLPKNAPVLNRHGKVRIPGSYNLFTEKGYQDGIPGDDIRQDCPIFWINGNRYEADRYFAVLRNHYPKFTLVCLPANRIDKFVRILPKCKRAVEGCQDAYDKWAKRLTADQRKALTMQDKHPGPRHIMASLDPTAIHDPDLKDGIRISRLNLDKVVNERKQFQSVLSLDSMSVACNNPMNKYPLAQAALGGYTRTTVPKDHVYTYMNAVHAQQGN